MVTHARVTVYIPLRGRLPVVRLLRAGVTFGSAAVDSGYRIGALLHTVTTHNAFGLVRTPVRISLVAVCLRGLPTLPFGWFVFCYCRSPAFTHWLVVLTVLYCLVVTHVYSHVPIFVHTFGYGCPFVAVTRLHLRLHLRFCHSRLFTRLLRLHMVVVYHVGCGRLHVYVRLHSTLRWTVTIYAAFAGLRLLLRGLLRFERFAYISRCCGYVTPVAVLTFGCCYALRCALRRSRLVPVCRYTHAPTVARGWIACLYHTVVTPVWFYYLPFVRLKHVSGYVAVTLWIPFALRWILPLPRYYVTAGSL